MKTLAISVVAAVIVGALAAILELTMASALLLGLGVGIATGLISQVLD